jgi:hypothetical protein
MKHPIQVEREDREKSNSPKYDYSLSFKKAFWKGKRRRQEGMDDGGPAEDFDNPAEKMRVAVTRG